MSRHHQRVSTSRAPATPSPSTADDPSATASQDALAAERRAAAAESRLAALTARHDALIAATGGITWTVNAQGNLTDEAALIRAAFGADPDATMHPDDRDRVLAAWQDALATGARFETHLRVRRADGVAYPVVLRAAPARGPDGQISEWIGVTTPLPERAESASASAGVPDFFSDVADRQALEQRVRFQSSMLERTYDAIFMWELGGAIVYWNRGAEQLYGYSAGEVIGRRRYDVLSTRLPEPVEQFEARLAHEGSWSGELTHIARDGHEVAVLSRKQVLHSSADAGGEARVYVFETARDITDRRQLELDLRRSEQYFRAIFEQIASAIALATLDGHIAGVNRRFTELVGYTAEELESITWRDFTYPDDIALDQSYVDQLLSGAISEYSLEKRYVRKDGTVIWVQLFTTILRGQDGSPDLLLGIIQDITDRRRMEEERAYTLNIVSHELKTPLTSLHATLQILERRAARGDAIDLVQFERVLALSRRMSRMIDDLLDAARLESGGVTLSIEQVDLAAICRQLAEEQSIASGRTVTLDLPAGDLYVTADAMRVGQVLVNLLSNALKYSPTGTPVTLRLRAEGKTARVEVVDSGPGIPADAQAHLFERAYRVPGAQVLHGSGVGLGLGLFITRRLVELQGGRIGVRSQPGKGCTFWFTLPLAPQPA